MRNITILLPAYNAANYIKEAIESILNQSFSDFDLLIIDDASTDETSAVIKSYSDTRIKLEKNSKNLKLAGTLNRGIDMIHSKYIVRMDADDISKPGRIERLVKFMEENPETDVCSSWLETFGNGENQIMIFPVGDQKIKCELLFYSSVAHAASIWRTSSLKKYNLRFDENIRLAQDYDFWERASSFLRFDCIPESLYLYRYINTEIHYSGQQQIADTIREKQLRKLEIDFSNKELALHNQISRGNFEINNNFLQQCDRWFTKLKKANLNKKIYPLEEFNKLLENKWYVIRDYSINSEFRKHFSLYRSSLFNFRYKLSYGKKNLIQLV
jgi:glycosyltransferase involved in cell wall biosynthesis